eukprot:5046799-Amphidinium_carterae.1
MRATAWCSQRHANVIAFFTVLDLCKGSIVALRFVWSFVLDLTAATSHVFSGYTKPAAPPHRLRKVTQHEDFAQKHDGSQKLARMLRAFFFFHVLGSVFLVRASLR